MQGYSHALSGATGWLACTSASSAALGWYDQTTEVALVGAVLCAGAAMVPDTDHTEGTIAYSLPSVEVGDSTLIPSPTRVVCGGVNAISGGHRHGTHSHVGIIAFAILAWLISFLIIPIQGRDVALGSGIVAVLLVAFAVKALGINHSVAKKRSLTGALMGSWLGVWVIALGTAGAATWLLDYRWAWLPLVVALGAFLHCVGDTLTTQGVPWLWPWNPKPPKWLKETPGLGWIVTRFWMPNGYFRFHILGDTDSRKEKVFGVLMGLYVTYLVFYEIAAAYGHDLDSTGAAVAHAIAATFAG